MVAVAQLRQEGLYWETDVLCRAACDVRLCARDIRLRSNYFVSDYALMISIILYQIIL